MSFRARITLLAAAAVAVAVVIASGVAFFEVRHQLYTQVDNTLKQQRSLDQGDFGGFRGGGPSDRFGNDGRMFQAILTDGSVVHPGNQKALPVGTAERDVATGKREYALRSVRVDGVHLRMITRPATPNDLGIAAGQLARPLAETDNTLHDLRLVLLIIAAAGIAIAAALGAIVARTALRPVKRLTKAAEHVAETQDLSASIPVESNDELGRLAESFNEMLTALAASRDQQTQLVADASHELRTPLTSLRTNIEVLARAPDMDPVERERLLADVTAQLEEFGVLVEDLVALAREDTAAVEQEKSDVRLDDLVRGAAERARRHAPTLQFRVTTEPCLVHGQRGMLERTFANLLDNASKWSPPGGAVDVVQSVAGEVTVRDHGPGIEPEARDRVFDRFYRAPAARSMPGSGLGLAIVRRVVQTHGGTVVAEDAPGGGTLMRVKLPIIDLGEPQPIEMDPEPEPLPRA
ncbi:MAG TPA: HAMP domain-containing sensor histidine kinase [Acidimicrobiia bacterium]